MDIAEKIDAFHKFFELYPELVPIDNKSITVKFSKLSEFNYELGEEIINNFEDTKKCLEIVFSEKDSGSINSFNSSTVESIELVEKVESDKEIPNYFKTTKEKVFYLLFVYKNGLVTSEIKAILGVEKDTLSHALSEREQEIQPLIQRLNERLKDSSVSTIRYQLTQEGREFVQKLINDYEIRKKSINNFINKTKEVRIIKST